MSTTGAPEGNFCITCPFRTHQILIWKESYRSCKYRRTMWQRAFSDNLSLHVSVYTLGNKNGSEWWHLGIG